MKLFLDKNIAEIYKDGKLAIRLSGPKGCILEAHIPDLSVVNVVKVEGVTTCVEGSDFVSIDVQQGNSDFPCCDS